MANQSTTGLTGLKTLWLPAALLSGCVLALTVSQPLFRAIPTDMQRISVLLDTLDDSSQAPTIIAFGNSVTMAGLDMGIVRDELPGRPRAFNFGSTGQSFSESYLYFQKIPPDTRVVMQFIDITAMTIRDADLLDNQKYNAFYMYGYRPDDRTRQGMRELDNSDIQKIMAKSALQHRLDSRWAIRQLPDWIMRNFLRKDLQLTRSIYDLEFPSSGAESLPERLFARDLALRYPLRTGAYRPDEAKLQFLQEMTERLHEQNIQPVLILMPLHPAACASRSTGYCSKAQLTFQAFADEIGVIMLDGVDQIPGELFADSVHPTEAGAVIFSTWLAGQLHSLVAQGRLKL